MTTYDQWKLRSDRDELQQPEEERHDECPDCGGLDGLHDRRCPERAGDFIDREIDRQEEPQS